MKNEEIYLLINEELEKAKSKFPLWPDDVIHSVAVMAEESGECIKAALDLTYSDGTKEHLEDELIQTAAMCVRCIENLRNSETFPRQS